MKPVKSADPDISRTRLERMLFIDAQIRQGRHPNATQLAQAWADRIGSGEPVDRKTIQRDLDYLRCFQVAPIEFSRQENGFYYTDPTWVMPHSLRLSEGELLSLLLARQMGGMYAGTPLADKLACLFQKLRVSLTDAVDADPAIIARQFSFHHHPSRPIQLPIWREIFKGIRESRILSLVYRGFNDIEPREREVEPVHLANVDDDWYLVGYCLLNQGWRHFSVSRIQEARAGQRTFAPRAGFDPERHFANRFGKFIASPGSRQFQLELRFTPAAAPGVKERRCHPRQKLKEEKDGGVSLSFPVPSLIEAKRFCLGWGKEVEVLAPAELRQEIAAEAREMARKNGE